MDDGINPNIAKRSLRLEKIILGRVFDDYIEAKKKLKTGTITDYLRVMREAHPSNAVL
ncbi:MAG: hypothetical protein V3V31_08955 [Methylococcales bacterium]